MRLLDLLFGTRAYKLGARFWMLLPVNHLSFQKRVLAPSPISVIMARERRHSTSLLTWSGRLAQDLLEGVVLQEGIPDRHIWRLSASGEYTAKSAYDALFEGALSFAPYERIWKSWAPPKCRFFMWLVAHNRCWTADRLARRGLPHPDRCLLCETSSTSSLDVCLQDNSGMTSYIAAVLQHLPRSQSIPPLMPGGIRWSWQ